MRKITCYTTGDGVIHEHHRNAKAHAEKRYGDALLHHASKLAVLDKYMAASEYLDEYAHDLAALAALKDDIEIQDRDCQFPDE